MMTHFVLAFQLAILFSIMINESWTSLAGRKDDHLVEIMDSDGDLCKDMMTIENNGMDMTHLHPICTNMVPRSGVYQAEPTSTSPWEIYTWKPEIQQYLTHPIVLGSDDGKQKFVNYMITAKAVDGGHIVGHFEYQWDATPICCYVRGQNYTMEGPRLSPNLLMGAQGVRVQTANQTVLWTAPRYFEGSIVFVATFWKSGKLYWPNVTSEPVLVIKRNLTKHHFNGY